MAGANDETISWGDVVTTTLENRSKKLKDNITSNNALLYRLKEKGRSDPFDGGRELIEEISYAQNQSFLWYSGFEPLNTTLNETMTAARYPLKQAAVSITISGIEQLQNRGREAMISLIDARVKNAEATFWNQMSAGIYSDGTGWGGKQIGGLQLLISKAPTSGTVGGIDSAAQPWWRNLAVNANTDPLGVITSSNVTQYFNKITVASKRNSDGIGLIATDNNIYLAYLASLQTIQRIVEDKMAAAGFTSLEYMGAGKRASVVLDGGKNGQIPTNTAYFINDDYISYRPHSARNFKAIGGDRVNVNQDAIVRLYAWCGNLTSSGRQFQATLFQ